MNIIKVVDRTQHQGLGDTIKAITKALGVKPCTPCQKRAEKLNRMVPYNRESNGEKND